MNMWSLIYLIRKNARRQKAEIKFIDVDNNNQELATSGELKESLEKKFLIIRRMF